MRYALGVADRAEITLAEQRFMHEPDFADLVAHYDVLFFGIASETAPITPPKSVWLAIEDQIDNLAKSPGTQTIRSDSLSWEPFLPGVQRKILRIDKDTATSLVLYQIAAGAEVGNHSHAVIEECLVLDGEIEVDGITVRAGDMHLAFTAQRHGPLFSRTGALVYIRG
ncbi:MAG: cupin domain-containing protein, partial [Asticcacaulis sp.]